MSARTAGYSGTPLARKLGIGEGTNVYGIELPDDYRELVAPLPAGARIVERAPARPAFVHLFVTRRAELERRLIALRRAIVPDGTIWVSWPKRASGVNTDVTEDVVRDVALPIGLVDVKVCAVSAVWSGLKLVIRKELRH